MKHEVEEIEVSAITPGDVIYDDSATGFLGASGWFVVERVRERREVFIDVAYEAVINPRTGKKQPLRRTRSPRADDMVLRRQP